MLGEIDALKLNQWLQYLEVYFSVHEVSEAQRISFSHLKLEGHALTWWESDVIARRLGNEPPMKNWKCLRT
jgi:hypothetical protein